MRIEVWHNGNHPPRPIDSPAGLLDLHLPFINFLSPLAISFFQDEGLAMPFFGFFPCQKESNSTLVLCVLEFSLSLDTTLLLDTPLVVISTTQNTENSISSTVHSLDPIELFELPSSPNLVSDSYYPSTPISSRICDCCDLNRQLWETLQMRLGFWLRLFVLHI